MKWGSSISAAPSLAEALSATADAVQLQLGQLQLGDQSAQLVVCFVSPHHDPSMDMLPSVLRERFPDAVLLGCTGGGIIGAGRELESGPAVSLTAGVLPNVGLVPFHFAGGQTPETPASWQQRLGLSPEHQPAFLLLPDPFSCDPASMLECLDEAFPGAPKAGGLASGARLPGGHALLLEDQLHREGVAGVALYGDVDMRCVVAQGCRPIGPTLTVTKAEANMVLRLNGGPAVAALDRVFSQLSEDDRARFQQAPMLGLAAPTAPIPGRGDFLVRNIIGLDRRIGAIGVSALVAEDTQVCFHLRDARSSADDLDELLSRHQENNPPPAGALLFSCLGRGRGLYGEPDHDSRVFRRRLGATPLGGFFCNGEIGPVHQTTHLHSYTSSFAIFQPRGWN